MDPRCCLLAQTKRCFGKKPCCSFVLFSGAYFRALTLCLMESIKAKCKALFSSRGCFGCFTKPALIIAVDEPSKSLTIQGQKSKRSSFSEDFWSSSACELDNSTVQSQRSISSISMSNQPLDPSASSSQSSEFVNHGLLLWHQTRQEWLKNKRPEKREQPRDSVISWNATYESLLGNNKPFPQPIPLSEMVDFLVDIWDQEGLYD
ncbi:hypothetical protein COLO4_18853 [Corchorus olitorius]|uniref:Gag1-like clamp domain-containing protein n=1 Tax=Corchorus olitorius TaxID=93759 RepID=A0A1R3J7L6_9ROSI|nr:hypothetical protein COLO4_18853 [Corchorus olitorius]